MNILFVFQTTEKLRTSQNKMFAALKYHSTDYLYEVWFYCFSYWSEQNIANLVKLRKECAKRLSAH